LNEHLGAWIGPFTHAIKVNAEPAFYRVLAELTKHVILEGMADSSQG
jgi:TorA maturation chaperone TorD